MRTHVTGTHEWPRVLTTHHLSDLSPSLTAKTFSLSPSLDRELGRPSHPHPSLGLGTWGGFHTRAEGGSHPAPKGGTWYQPFHKRNQST